MLSSIKALLCSTVRVYNECTEKCVSLLQMVLMSDNITVGGRVTVYCVSHVHYMVFPNLLPEPVDGDVHVDVSIQGSKSRNFLSV